MQGSKKSFVVYCQQIAALNEISDAQLGKLIRYLTQFLQSGREPPKREANAVLVAFNLFKLQISIDLEKYEQSRERMRRWNKKRVSKQSDTSDNVNDNDNDNVNVNVNDNGENKNNKIDFYSSLQNSEEEKEEEQKQRLIQWFDEKIVPWWNRRTEGTNIPQLRRSTYARARLAADLMRKYKPEEVEEVVRKVCRSDYMNGRTKEKRLASFRFVFTEENFVKILEGEYR